jgi:hypothetical protein
METSLQNLQDAVAEIPGIAALLLFGCRATGKARPTSDLDIAVLPDADLTDRERHRLRMDIMGELAPQAPEERVDVVLLDEAPATLRQQVMVDGKMIVCTDLPAWKRLRVQTMREYGDFEWARRIYRRALRRRLMEGRRPDGESERALESIERARKILAKARRSLEESSD